MAVERRFLNWAISSTSIKKRNTENMKVLRIKQHTRLHKCFTLSFLVSAFNHMNTKKNMQIL